MAIALQAGTAVAQDRIGAYVCPTIVRCQTVMTGSEASSEASDPFERARTLMTIATQFEAQGEWKQASDAIEQAIALLHPFASEPRPEAAVQLLAQALNLQGNLQLSQGQESEALTTWQQAETAYRDIRNTIGIIGSQVNQARALQTLGLYRRAAILLRQVAQTLQSQPDSFLKVNALWELGRVFWLSGDLNQAQAVLQTSLALAEQLRESEQINIDEASSIISGILLNLGNVARAQGVPELARSLYQQSVATAPSLSAKVQAQAVQFSELIEDEQWSAARDVWMQIQPQLAELPLNQAAIYARINIAQSLMTWSDRERERNTSILASSFSLAPAPSDIARLLAAAVQQARDLGDRRAESYGLGYLGHLYEMMQQWDDAQKLTQAALDLAQSLNAPDILYLWNWQAGRLWVAQAKTSEWAERAIASRNQERAIAAYAEAIDRLQSLRRDLVAVNPDVQFSFREGVEPIYRQFVELLLRSPQSGQPSQAHLRQAREVIELLQLAELDNFFREACLNTSPVEIEQLDPHAAVVYPILLPNQIAVIVSIPNQPLHYHETKLPQADIEQLINQMRQSLRPNSFIEDRLPIAQHLYNLLLRSTESILTANDIKTLVFVLDGSLRNIPMAALHDGQHYLIETYSIALTPGLQLLPSQPLQGQRLNVLIAGLSQARQGFPGLPNVTIEVEQIKSEVSAQVLLDQSFTHTRFQNQISSRPISIVHLATHGQFSSNADDTFVLTWDDRITVKQLDQILRSREGRLNPIELLVLSACQTATGDRRAALGMAGVAVRSGARSTLATLWSVSDRSTAALMVIFYRELSKSGVTKAEALRRAQVALLQQTEYQSPFYWAPFVLLGNWL
jgi:CHAT domain-containing protein